MLTQDVGFGSVPVVYAINAKAVYDLTPRDRVWMVNVAGVDEIRLASWPILQVEDGVPVRHALRPIATATGLTGATHLRLAA